MSEQNNIITVSIFKSRTQIKLSRNIVKLIVTYQYLLIASDHYIMNLGHPEFGKYSKDF